MDISEYTQKIFRLRLLKSAGYPYRANDLTPEEWEDLGRVEEFMASRAEAARANALQELLIRRR